MQLGRDFFRLSSAAAISNFGDGVMGAAFPLLVATITRDPILVAGATVALRLPWLMFALISGALVDRMDRRRVMVTTDLVRGVLVGAMALTVIYDVATVPIAYVIAFGLGLTETFFDTSSEAIVPALVSEDMLPAANGRLQAVEWVGNAFVGPPVGAALFALAPFVPFGLDALTFFAAALLIWLIPGRFEPERLALTSLRIDVGTGLKWLLAHRVLRTLSIMAGITNAFVMGIVAVFVLFAQEELGVGELGYGILLSSTGLGGLAGAVVAPRLVDRFGSGSTIQGTVVAGVAVAIVIGLTSSPWVAGPFMAIYGASITAWNVVAVTLRQSLTPDELRGRVAGAARLLAWGAQPVGAALGGLVAAAVGLRAPFFVAAAVWGVMWATTVRIVNNQSVEEALGRRVT